MLKNSSKLRVAAEEVPAIRAKPRFGIAHRADLAALAVECLDDDSTVGRIFHGVDPEIKERPPGARGYSVSGCRKAVIKFGCSNLSIWSYPGIN